MRRIHWSWPLLAIACVASIALWMLRPPALTASNIYPGDYVGPDACGECHEENHALWLEHPHRRMNQNPSEETVKGDFSGAVLHYRDGRVVFDRAKGDYVMLVYRNDELERIHKVTRTVGSVYVQYYIGTQIMGPEPASHPAYNMEVKLPFGYSIELDRWLPEIYLDSTYEEERRYQDGTHGDFHFEAPIHNWNRSCLMCHNTYPYVARLWKQRVPRADSSISREGFPVSAIDWRGEVYDQGGFVHPVRSRTGPEIRGVAADELITVGISCESCHFGGREHAEEGKRISFVPRSPDLTIRHPDTNQPAASDRNDPFVVNSICNQCHNAPLYRFPSDEPAVNSNEASAVRAGACTSMIKCTDCHNPHERGPGSGAPVQETHVEACLKCHDAYADEEGRRQHTRHSENVSCLDCHMPRIVSGLDTVVRSHAISVPGDPKMVRAGSLNACNLCHLERPIAWTLQELERGWGRRAVRQEEVGGWDAYGPADASPVGEAWLRSPDRYVRAAAIEAFGRSPLVGQRVPRLLTGLRDEYAFNRTFALIVLDRVLGRSVSEQEFDLLAEGPERLEQVDRLERSLASVDR